MRRFVYISLLGLAMMSCRNTYESKRPYQIYPQEQKFFSSVINESESSSIQLSEDNYPISVKLMKDGRFYYNLPRLGDGWGRWKHRDGYIDLYAERTLFVMQMQIHALDPNNPKNLALEFSDRFGPKYLHLNIK